MGNENIEEKAIICIRKVNEKINRVRLDLQLTRPLRQLNESCKFKEAWKEKHKIFEHDKYIKEKKKFRENNKIGAKESQKKYYRKNKKRLQKISRKYREENKEKIIKKNRENYPKNKEKINRRNREYYHKNKERLNRYKKYKELKKIADNHDKTK